MTVVGAYAEPGEKSVWGMRSATSRAYVLGDYYRRGFITYGIYTA